MLQKRKWLALALAGALSLSMLAGCTETQAPVPSASSPAPSSADTNPDVPAPDTSGDESAAGTGNVLVVYFSASGNTEAVANYIAEAAGGDLFEITPAEPYTDEDLNWTDENSRVTREHEDESLRDVALTATEVENWDSYDTVFIGYPIWWGIAAWPVDSFVEANDFTGKTVIPFCTSSSSGLGESGALLAELAGSGDWQDGERFRSSAAQSDIEAWVRELGLLYE